MLYPIVRRKSVSKFHDLIVSGRLPERNELRLGPHTPIWAKACSKTMADALKLSIFGVCRRPLFLFRYPSSLRKSSTTISNTFFAPAGAGAGGGTGGGGLISPETAPLELFLDRGTSVPRVHTLSFQLHATHEGFVHAAQHCENVGVLIVFCPIPLYSVLFSTRPAQLPGSGFGVGDTGEGVGTGAGVGPPGRQTPEVAEGFAV